MLELVEKLLASLIILAMLVLFLFLAFPEKGGERTRGPAIYKEQPRLAQDGEERPRPSYKEPENLQQRQVIVGEPERTPPPKPKVAVEEPKPAEPATPRVEAEKPVKPEPVVPNPPKTGTPTPEKLAEAKKTEPEPAEPKAAEPKAAEPKAAEPQAVEPKAAEPEAVEPARPTPTEPKAVEPARPAPAERHQAFKDQDKVPAYRPLVRPTPNRADKSAKLQMVSEERTYRSYRPETNFTRQPENYATRPRETDVTREPEARRRPETYITREPDSYVTRRPETYATRDRETYVARRPETYVTRGPVRTEGTRSYVRQTQEGNRWRRTHYYECVGGSCDCGCARPYWARSGPICD